MILLKREKNIMIEKCSQGSPTRKSCGDNDTGTKKSSS